MANVVKIAFAGKDGFGAVSSKDAATYFLMNGCYYRLILGNWHSVDGRTVPKDAKKLLKAGN